MRICLYVQIKEAGEADATRIEIREGPKFAKFTIRWEREWFPTKNTTKSLKTPGARVTVGISVSVAMQAGEACGGCGSSGKWVLHTVRQRASYRRICTDCVLKNHPSLFCPLCLVVFDKESFPLPAPSDRLICHRCSSIAHRSCAVSSSSFLCPPCSNPSFAFFDPTPRGAIDLDLAKALLAAARIAATSIQKAAAAARVDAERRVKEAAFARKKAREALDRIAFLLVAKETPKKPLRSTPNGVEGGKIATNGLLSLSAAAAQRSAHASEDWEKNKKVGDLEPSLLSELLLCL